jgi:hypothetical protein
MYLGEMAAKSFYPTWLGLLEFTNQKHHIVPELKKMRVAKVLNPQQLLPNLKFFTFKKNLQSPRKRDSITFVAKMSGINHLLGTYQS